jgi:ATP-dependent RNA helicase RhlE
MAAFRSGKIRTLVATDIAARGIDVDGVSHVINYDLPNIPETYVHRIGRTARAGASGIAISLVSSDEMAFLRDIEKLIRQQVPMTGSESNWDPTRDNAAAAAEARRGGNRGSGHRGRGQQPQRNAGGRRDDNGEARKPRHQGKGKKGGGRKGQRPNAPSRPHNGNAIGDVGFMAQRPRRGGMGQGSAY